MLPNNDISFQLYTSRNFPPLSSQFEFLKSQGFTDVQPYFSYGNRHTPEFDVQATKAKLNELGMTCKTGHFDLALFEKEFDRVRDIAKAMGMWLVVAPWLEVEERPTDRAGWEELGKRLEIISDKCDEAGLTFSWHNHEFEFIALPDGSFPIEHTLGERVKWEPDLAWLTIGKQDPEAWLRRYSGRVTAVHVKDVAPEGQNLDESGFADLGTGIVPWKRLLPAAAAAGAQLFVIEHDNPSNFERFASNSIRELKNLVSEQ